ncbi:MAG: 3-dehydroquinate synthase [Bacteroidia bacterium]|nr:3-dehydroquinate synthase [Bacteroidia bacterium]
MKEIFSKEYNIFLGDDVFEKLAETLIHKEYSKVFVLMDNNTSLHCWPLLSAYLVNFVPIIIPDGEVNKNIRQAEFIWETLQSNFADRRALLINLGGGVISDIGGFCAATFKRGIDFINVPTTLLSMVDAAVGGKQGVDMLSFKNVIGVFKHPKEVFIYPPFLNTLNDNEKRNGLAELCKHALISDKALFEKLEAIPPDDWGVKLNSLIFQSLKIKVSIVKKDPLEKDLRKTLNFGHTIGHAIETASLLSDKVPLKHGEAVAIGIICEAFISKAIDHLSSKEFKNIVEYISNRFPKYKQKINQEQLILFMRNDKKNKEGNIHFTLLKKIGKAKVDIICEDDLIIQSLNYYQNL